MGYVEEKKYTKAQENSCKNNEKGIENHMKDFFKNKCMPMISKFSEHQYVKGIQQGVMALMSVTIFSGIVSILKTPPFPADTTNGFALAWISFSAANASWLEVVYQVTTGMMAMLAVIGIVTSLCNYYKMHALNPIIVSVAAFLIVSVNLVLKNPEVPVMGYTLDFTYLGAQGLFTAIIISIISVEILRYMNAKGIKIKMPASVPPMVSQPFEAMIASGAVLMLMIAIRIGFAQFDLLFPQIIMVILSPVLKGAESFWTIVFLFMLSRVLWFFGIHGTSIMFAVIMPIMTVNGVANLEAYNAGLPVDHILTGSFIIFQLGMLPAAIAMLIACKSQQLKTVARLGIVPSCFMISEPILFGTPFVFNPILFIPHVLSFGVSVGMAYLAMDFGLVGKPIFGVPQTIPGPFASFLSTLDWKSVILWFVIVIVCVLIYLPFLKKYDKTLLEQEKLAEDANNAA